MSTDLEALFRTFAGTIGRPAMADAEFGETFRANLEGVAAGLTTAVKGGGLS